MTITYLGEVHAQARNSKGTRSYSRVFKLDTSVKTERAYHVGSHASLPVIGSVHPDDAFAWCTDLSIDPATPWRGWTATAEYTTERQMAEDPVNDAAAINWNSEQFQRPAIFDKNGSGIVNSAGDPFDPPNMMDDSRRVVSVTKNLIAVPSWILTYQDAVNSDVFSIDGISIGVGKAKIQSVTVGEKQYRSGVTFRTVQFTIHLQKNGWLLEPLDAGFRERTSGGPPSGIKNIYNPAPNDSELPAAPVPLDGSGVALADPSPANSVFLSFAVYETLAFSVLPFT